MRLATVQVTNEFTNLADATRFARKLEHDDLPFKQLFFNDREYYEVTWEVTGYLLGEPWEE